MKSENLQIANASLKLSSFCCSGMEKKSDAAWNLVGTNELRCNQSHISCGAFLLTADEIYVLEVIFASISAAFRRIYSVCSTFVLLFSLFVSQGYNLSHRPTYS